MVDGKGAFLFGRVREFPFILSDFYCNNTKFMLNTTGIWCNTKIIAKIILSRVDKTYQNIDTGNLIYWEIKLNSPHEVISVETNWPEEKIELLDNEILGSLNSSGQTYHKVKITGDEGGKYY